MKNISVVIPCYNEEESLPLYFKAVDPVISKIENYKFDFVLINDGSKDNTLQVMNDIYMSRDDVTIVNESRNMGQNAALHAGLITAKGDYVIMMDVDLQDPVELLIDIAKKFDEGYEVVNPHRASRQTDSWFKRTTAGIFYKFINKLEGKQIIPENVNCFRGLSRRAVNSINSLPEKDRFYVSIVPLVGFKTATIDFERHTRDAGQSKYTFSKLFTHAFNLISTTTAKPLYFPIKFGTISMCLNGLLSLVFLILMWVYRVGNIPSQLYQSIFFIFFILFCTSCIIFFIGVICLYLHNILINTRQRPTTFIDQVYTQEDKNKTNNENN